MYDPLWQVTLLRTVQVKAAAAEDCRAELSKAERCYRKKLGDLNARIMQQAAERKKFDARRDACFQRLQYESCMIRNQLQVKTRVLMPPEKSGNFFP